jgi:hypothetical protein
MLMSADALRLLLCQGLKQGYVILAFTRIQRVEHWIPACAGMTIDPSTLDLTIHYF